MKVQDHEAAFLREHYVARGAKWCAEQLGLTERQIQRRVRELDVRRKARWTAKDDDMLRFQWGARTCAEIGKAMGRTPKAVYWRAKALGLGLGCPQGYAYLTHVAEEAGYSVRTMRDILKWAGVGLTRGPTNPAAVKRGRGARAYVTHIVDPVRAIEAVERWLAAEYVCAAAEARGLSAETLERLLVDDGRAGVRAGRKRRWRVPTDIIDEVVARHLNGESMAEAARRRGMHPAAMRRRLVRAGVWKPGETRKATRFDVEVIDAAVREAA